MIEIRNEGHDAYAIKSNWYPGLNTMLLPSTFPGEYLSYQGQGHILGKTTVERPSMSTSTEDEPAEDRVMEIHPTSSAGGVFSSRVSQRKAIHGNKATNAKEMDLEVASVSDAPEVEERDFHSKQVIRN